ncbi:MAG: N-methyl-L-tryptophan oxidase, partial [Cyclobacteriaceae bacterium]
LIRKAYFEHSSYIPLLEGAYLGWSQLEKQANIQLYWPTGIAYFGEPQDAIIRGVKEAANRFSIPLESREFSQFKMPENFECVFEPQAGFLSPERAISSLVDLARQKGAEILENQQVLDWRYHKGEITVRTSENDFKAKKLIITAGAFVSEVLKLTVPMKVTRQYLAWAETKHHQLGDFPCWMISEKEHPGCLYGFPAGAGLAGPEGMKLGYHRLGDELRPDLPDGSAKEADLLNGILKKYFVENLSVGEFKTCKYTYSPDDNFIVDTLSEFGNKVIVATGFSGHGFKFVPVIGEILADLAINKNTKHDIDFLSLKRFNTTQ